MAVMSFAHLKKKTKSDPEPSISCPKKEIQKITPRKKDNPGKKFLMMSRHCFGCLKFSVDYPETVKEKGWCAQPKEDKMGVVFKWIKKEYLVEQCPGKVLK